MDRKPHKKIDYIALYRAGRQRQRRLAGGLDRDTSCPAALPPPPPAPRTPECTTPTPAPSRTPATLTMAAANGNDKTVISLYHNPKFSVGRQSSTDILVSMERRRRRIVADYKSRCERARDMAITVNPRDFIFPGRTPPPPPPPPAQAAHKAGDGRPRVQDMAITVNPRDFIFPGRTPPPPPPPPVQAPRKAPSGDGRPRVQDAGISVKPADFGLTHGAPQPGQPATGAMDRARGDMATTEVAQVETPERTTKTGVVMHDKATANPCTYFRTRQERVRDVAVTAHVRGGAQADKCIQTHLK